MSAILRTLLCVVLLVMVSFGASATNFSVLLGGNGGGGGGDHEPLSISNPMYEENGQQGENPLYEPSSVVFNPNQFEQAFDVIFEVVMDGDVEDPRAYPGVKVSEGQLPDWIWYPVSAFAFEVNVYNASTGEKITDFPDGIEFTFDIPGLSDEAIDDAVLGYFDEEDQMWKAEDKVLEKHENGTLCGTTNHLTVFAVMPANVIPEPGTLGALMVLGMMGVRRRRVI